MSERTELEMQLRHRPGSNADAADVYWCLAYRRRSSVNLGGGHMYEKLSKCPNYTYVLEKLKKCPILHDIWLKN